MSALQTGGEGRPVAELQYRHEARLLLNAMTVDVEDYFQVQALSDGIPREAWDQIPRRVESNIDRLLQLFSDNRVSATFFTLGWIAERHPEMMRRIAAAGHELASHGYDHTRVDRLSPASFREDVRRTKGTIEEIAGCRLIGYRAPTFSIGSDTPWAYEILENEDYHYSSSIYPIRHDLYGAADAPRSPFQPGSGRLWEFPLTTRRLLGQNFPCAGGGYFRLLPYWTSRRNLYHINAADELPCIFYLHPWEIDAGQPRVVGLRMRSRLRHYTNLKTMPSRLSRLVQDFRWGRMDEVFSDRLAPLAARRPAEIA
jgi:polysaccharide deacetylase family protein (PEP-CTERM system associated)